MFLLVYSIHLFIIRQRKTISLFIEPQRGLHKPVQKEKQDFDGLNRMLFDNEMRIKI